MTRRRKGGVRTAVTVKIVEVEGQRVLEVGVPIHLPGISETVVVTTTKGVDLMSGLGQARELSSTDGGGRKAQIDATFQAEMKESGKIMSGEQALARVASSFDGQRVLGIGGGPISEWAMEHAILGGAREATVAGQLPKPPASTPQGAELKVLETTIYELELSDLPVPHELTDRHHEIISDHVDAELARVDRLEAQLAATDDSKLVGCAREKAEQDLSKLKNALDPFLGSRVERNENTLNSKDLLHIQGDVSLVKPITDGPHAGAMRVFFADGTSKVVDQIVPSIGADHNAPGGMDNMLQALPQEVEFIPVIADGRVVGLESNPPGINVSGAAMTGSTGFNMPRALLKRIPENMRDAFMSSLLDHAQREAATVGSKGIIPGIENVGQDPELMREMLELPPEARAQALDSYLTTYAFARDKAGGPASVTWT